MQTVNEHAHPQSPALNSVKMAWVAEVGGAELQRRHAQIVPADAAEADPRRTRHRAANVLLQLRGVGARQVGLRANLADLEKHGERHF